MYLTLRGFCACLLKSEKAIEGFEMFTRNRLLKVQSEIVWDNH